MLFYEGAAGSHLTVTLTATRPQSDITGENRRDCIIFTAFPHLFDEGIRLTLPSFSPSDRINELTSHQQIDASSKNNQNDKNANKRRNVDVSTANL